MAHGSWLAHAYGTLRPLPTSYLILCVIVIYPEERERRIDTIYSPFLLPFTAHRSPPSPEKNVGILLFVLSKISLGI